jgi:hypothetical protein
VTIRRGFGLDDLDLLTTYRHQSELQAITPSSLIYTLQFTVTQTLGFSVFPSRILATDFNTIKSSLHSPIPFLTSQSTLTAYTRDSPNFDSGGLACSLYSLGAGPAGNILCCYRSAFTSPLHRNGSSFIAECVFISAGTSLPSRCLTMNFYCGSAIPAFKNHVTIHYIHIYIYTHTHAVP